MIFWWDFESFFKWWNVYINTDSISDIGVVTLPYWPQNVNNHGCCLKYMYIQLIFEVKKTYKTALNGPLQLIPTSYAIYKTVCLQNRIYFCILMLASSTWLLNPVITDWFLLAEWVMWYKCMWLESQKKCRKVRKAYDTGYSLPISIKLASSLDTCPCTEWLKCTAVLHLM